MIRSNYLGQGTLMILQRTR